MYRALEFMVDALYDGRAFRALTVIDEGTREALAIDLGMSIPSERVIRVLDDLIRLYGDLHECASTMARSSWRRLRRMVCGPT